MGDPEGINDVGIQNGSQIDDLVVPAGSVLGSEINGLVLQNGSDAICESG